MTAYEKIRKLTEGMNRANVSRDAGLPSQTISNIVNTERTPNAEDAFRIAKALRVSLDWLADETRGMPAEPMTAAAEAESLLTPEVRKQLEDIASKFHGRVVCMAAAMEFFAITKDVELRASTLGTFIHRYTKEAGARAASQAMRATIAGHVKRRRGQK